MTLGQIGGRARTDSYKFSTSTFNLCRLLHRSVSNEMVRQQ